MFAIPPCYCRCDRRLSDRNHFCSVPASDGMGARAPIPVRVAAATTAALISSHSCFTSYFSHRGPGRCRHGTVWCCCGTRRSGVRTCSTIVRRSQAPSPTSRAMRLPRRASGVAPFAQMPFAVALAGGRNICTRPTLGSPCAIHCSLTPTAARPVVHNTTTSAYDSHLVNCGGCCSSCTVCM